MKQLQNKRFDDGSGYVAVGSLWLDNGTHVFTVDIELNECHVCHIVVRDKAINVWNDFVKYGGDTT